MNNHRNSNFTRLAIAIVVAAVLTSASALSYSHFEATVTRTVTNTSTVVQSASGACLKEVPQSAVFSSYSNSTSQGYTVTFSNGTKDFFPLKSCPVPVTPDNYQIDSTIEANPKFIAAENGSTYEANNACNCSYGGNISNSTGQYASLNFVLYGNQQIYPCGPSSYWTFNRLGLILVIIPINSTGGLDFSNSEIQSLPGTNIFTCTTTTATSSSSTGIATASVSNSSDGLSLNLQVLPGGNGTFTVTAYESNLLSSVNNVTEANQWKYPADLLNPANNCAPTNDPVGFAIFQGYYGMSNYTSGKALPLYNTNVEFHCTENIYANEYVFQPLSDSISVYNHGQFETNGTASLSLLTGGYWTGGAGTPTSASFSEFRGVYTVLAADEWGNVLLLHFTVV